MEFLQLVETIRSEEAARNAEAASRFLSEDGFRSATGNIRKHPRYSQMLVEALRVVENARKSRRGMDVFNEAMGTADFPLLMGDVLDRQLLGTYTEAPSTWSIYCRRGTVPDFRTVKRFAVDGAEGVLPSVGEKGTYLPQVLSETKYSYAVSKYGRIIKWDWEAWVNDDMDGLASSSPARLGKAARRSEDKFTTQLHVDANGPHASLYSTANKNKIVTANGAASANPVLGIAGLQDALTVLGLQVDADGEPISVDGVILEVGPALAQTAKNILSASQIIIGADSASQRILTANWMRDNMTLVVNPYIPIVASSANGNTTWFVHAAPGAGRPAMEMGFLRGYEAPQLFQKISNQMRIGGAANAMDGSFEDDTTAFKVRHVFGGTSLDGKGTVGSNGSGS